MKPIVHKTPGIATALALSLAVTHALALATATATVESAVSFSRDIRPILSEHCFKCHGPDEGARKADLRLDLPGAALRASDAGDPVILPGHPGKSDLVRRIFTDDRDDLMPPSKAKVPLTKRQKELLEEWIAAGAEFQPHWSFAPPAQAPLPEVSDPSWSRNAIDRFVLARLEAETLAPSPEAGRYTLVRRLYLDLIGMPPTPEQADAFVNDPAPDAYENLVDALLASPHYGERWARRWLDLARYADTNGYEKDRPRSIWPYRDWVIAALNADMPFDQFTVEQIAGDMLPGATLQQRIATGFHRNTMINEEGGIDPLEYRFFSMVDRVAATGTVWLGLTTECAQCHTHKYDPITHHDYYSLMALLNNADEPDVEVPQPDLAERRRTIEKKIAALEESMPGQLPQCDEKFDAWLKTETARAVPWKVLRPVSMESDLPKLEQLDDGSVYSSGDITKRDVFLLKFTLEKTDGPVTALRLEALPDARLPAGGPGRGYYEGRKGDFFLSEFTATAGGSPIAFADASHTFGQISVGSGTADAKNVLDGEGSTGWSTATREGEPHHLVLNLTKPLATPATNAIELLFERHFAASLGRFRISATTSTVKAEAKQMPVALEQLLTRDPSSWSAADRARLQRQFLSVAPELDEVHKKIAALRAQLPEQPVTMIFEERPADNPRKTFRHHRGEYLQPEDEVAPRVPGLFEPLPEDAPANRLTFARWLVSERNPLVGRVTVNRAWQAFFGRGIVRTSGDFGFQGELPSHPALLDWLAVEFANRGWSFKELHRLIVTSAAYRQSSRITPELLERDPENILLARGPRFRIDGEMVRDLALVASGLLSEKMGGPSVYPPQPESVTALSYGSFKWAPSQGEDRYRRALYTFSKRTTPFAAYVLFDAPTGETCIARRERSNTPLQALTLLNDEMFLEAARAMGEAATNLSSAGATDRDRAALLLRRCITRPPADAEIADVLAFYCSQLGRLQRGELDANEILNREAGAGAPDAHASAAWTIVARTLLNLDETITKN